MNNRRPLTAGLSRPDAAMERQFVRGSDAKPAPPANQQSPTGALVPLSTRLRPDIANALRRASLERKLNGAANHSVQDIVEDALTPWLREQGYLI